MTSERMDDAVMRDARSPASRVVRLRSVVASLRTDAEESGVQGWILGEHERHTTEQHVVLLCRVFLHNIDKFGPQGCLECHQSLEVATGKINREDIGDDIPSGADHDCSVIEFPLEGRSDFHRLHLCFEGLRKSAVHKSVEALLELVQECCHET